MTKRRGGGLRTLAVILAVSGAAGGGLYLRGEGQKTDAAQEELAGWLQDKGAKVAVGKLAVDGACKGVQLPVFGLGQYHRHALEGNQNTREPEDVDVYVASGNQHNAAVYDYRFGEGENGTVRLGLGVPEAAAGSAAVAAQVCRTGGDGERSASFEVRMGEKVPTDWVVLRMAQLPPPAPASPSAPPR